MFLGEFEHAVDDKGRLSIPARFREELAQGLVLVRGLDGCLRAYPVGEWTRRAEEWADLDDTDPEARDTQRFHFTGAANASLDAQGRVLLPPNLRGFAQIGAEVVVTGMYRYLELWAKDRWQARRDQIEQAGIQGGRRQR